MAIIMVVVMKMTEEKKIIAMLLIFIMVILTCIFVVKSYPNEYFVDGAALSNEAIFYSPLGDASKLTEDSRSAEFPSVDGDANSPRHLFMFARNECSPKCIGKSPYTCDRGAVCITDKQVELISTRGNNADSC